jgi:hypothetical protein
MSCRPLVSAVLGIILVVGVWGPAVAGPSAAGGAAGRGIQVAAGATGPVDPADFTSSIDNPWFPLKPGTTYTYHGTKDGKPGIRVFAVTNQTKVVDGVTCVVVEDKLSLAGTPAERLLGYYAQDRDGDIWYFGEDAEELDSKGHVTNAEGWRAGLDGALPSFVMEATPTVGHAFAHDYTKDHFQVVSVAEAVKVPYGSFTDALMTEEWSQLERDTLTRKYYVRGVGEVRDVLVRGGKEEFLLVQVTR